MKKMVRVIGLAGVFGAGLALTASPASAHVTPDKDEVPADGYTSVTLTVPHGCEESPTRQVSIEVPESLNSITPSVVAGWEVEKVMEPLPEPVEQAEGEPLTERVSQVVYTAQAGMELPDGYRQSYTLGFRAPNTPGEHLFFKTVQTCVEGETPWIEEYTGEGEEPDNPSPVVLVTEPEDEEEASDDMEAEEAEGAAEGEAAAASDDDDGDSSTGIAVAGLIAGLLGLAAGGYSLVRTRSTSS